jgi:hypothetical protein
MKADLTGAEGNSQSAPVITVGAHGADPVGFTGAVTTASAAPNGIVERMSAGGSSSAPLLPATWIADADDRREPR